MGICVVSYCQDTLLLVGICIQEPSFVCIVTEYLERGTVRDLLLSKSRLEWNVRLNWALDTATGMAYLHSLEPCIIHRDLKTTNLLVDRGFNVKICDFGLSRFMSKDSVMSAVGTVQFAAPEVCFVFLLSCVYTEQYEKVLKHERYTEKADVFSFGTVLWELCTRERVFRGVPQIDVYKVRVFIVFSFHFLIGIYREWLLEGCLRYLQIVTQDIEL